MIAAAPIRVLAPSWLAGSPRPCRPSPRRSASRADRHRRSRSRQPIHELNPLHEIDDRAGAAAAGGRCSAPRWRCGPKRRGTPPRTPAVVQTQIILSVVGAVIMLVVGASLARAFGIVGAANLIRYRSKIDDPKDAVVMLCALAVGLAAGVGLYALAVVLDRASSSPRSGSSSRSSRGVEAVRAKIKAGDDTDALRPKIEAHPAALQARTTSCARRRTKRSATRSRCRSKSQTDRVSNAILTLDPEGHASVDWAEKKNKAT